MTPTQTAARIWSVVLCGAAACLFSAYALADPPARVARLSQIGGTVSFSPAGEEDWVLAQTNRPFITGDRIWSDAGSRAELQIGAASARLGANTSAVILNLDDTVAQFQIAQGTLNLRVRRIYGDQFFEIDTPNLAFSVRRAGDYRIDVDPSGNATVIGVRAGEGEAWGEGAAYIVGAGQQYTFVGEGLRDYSFAALPPQDEFDRWSFDRNRREDAAVAARYVSPEVIGYSDLDDYGTWRNVENYGNVWVPTSVAADWAPYHVGRWGWVEPWGWTWIDDAPWGFAPFHYGRWAYVSSRWCWVPGPIAVRPVYAPALVAFVGGGGFRIAISGGPVAGIAWFPLGPGEVYRPSYAYSRSYFTNINVSNTVVNTTVINNYYNNVNVTNVVYRNREAPGAITAVPAASFAGGEPVARHAVPVSRDVIAREQVTHIAAVAPSHAAVIAAGAAVAGGAAAVAIAGHRPPSAVLSRQSVAKSAPPPPPSSFAARASLLAAQPGKPLEAEKLTKIKTERGTDAPKVKMVAPSVTPQPLSKSGSGKGSPSDQAGAQDRMRDFKGPPSQGGPAPQDDSAMKGRKDKGAAQGGAAVPQPPAATQERLRDFKGPPPQGGPAPQDDSAMKGRKDKGGPQGGPQAGPVPQPPATGQERIREFKGPPPPQGGQVPQDERFKERKGAPQAAPVPQPPVQQQIQKGPPPPPPPQIQKGPPPPPPPPPQIQKGPPPPPPPQAGRHEPKPEEAKGKEKEKEKKDGQ